MKDHTDYSDYEVSFRSAANSIALRNSWRKSHIYSAKLPVQIIGYSLIVLFIALCLELGAYVVSQLWIPDFLLFSPPSIERVQFETYKKTRDPVLGWPAKSDLNGDRYDASGARPTPAFPEPGGECVTLYGDSFVYGEEVSDDEAWGNILSSRLGCRVGNFGVSGYGTDQALLRFETNSMDHARITILGIFPHDMMRNLTRYFYLLDMRGPLTFKPRFRMDGGELRFVPLPDLDYKQLALFAEKPESVLSQEDLLPGSSLGSVVNRFPYTLVMWKLLMHERVWNWIRGVPSWQGVMNRNHSSEGFEIALEIVNRFNKDCRAADRRRHCFVVLFPTPSSYHWYVDTGRLSFQELSEEFEKRGLPYLDLTLYFFRNLEGRSYCEVLVNPKECVGHLNFEGNRMVALAVEEYLRQINNAFAEVGVR